LAASALCLCRCTLLAASALCLCRCTLLAASTLCLRRRPLLGMAASILRLRRRILLGMAASILRLRRWILLGMAASILRLCRRTLLGMAAAVLCLCWRSLCWRSLLGMAASILRLRRWTLLGIDLAELGMEPSTLRLCRRSLSRCERLQYRLVLVSELPHAAAKSPANCRAFCFIHAFRFGSFCRTLPISAQASSLIRFFRSSREKSLPPLVRDSRSQVSGADTGAPGRARVE